MDTFVGELTLKFVLPPFWIWIYPKIEELEQILSF